MESIWDRNKQTIGKVAGISALALLVIGNLWLGSKALRGGEYGVSFTPWDVRSALLSPDDSPLWDSAHNILILGRAGEGNNAPYLTDTILIVRADPSTKSAKLISLPRDLLVELDNGNLTKLNALWHLTAGENRKNFDPIEKKVENITGLSIDHTVVFDLATLERVIEEVDGVVVYVPQDIYDPRFPTPAGGYETFSLQSGWRRLDAQSAMRFARSRYSSLGDFDRIARQQELVKGVKGKVASLNPIWNFSTLWSLYSAIQSNVITNLSITDARALWEFAKRLSLEEMEHFVLSTQEGLIQPYMLQTGAQPAATLVIPGDDPFDYATIRSKIRVFITN